MVNKPPVKYLLKWLPLAVVLVFYAWIQVVNFTPASGEDDVDGYLTVAKRMARGEPISQVQADPFLYHSHVWVQNDSAKVAPKYDPGYPALMAAAWWLGGDKAMFWVSPLAGGLALVGAFLLFRLWLAPFTAVVALITMACNPMFINYTAYPLTHAADLGFITWGMYFLWRWLRTPSIGGGILAGLILGAAGLVRHASSVLLLLVGVAVVAVIWRRGWGRAVGPVSGVLLAVAVVLAAGAAYNMAVFGAPFLSGYGLSGEQSAFSRAYLLNHYVNLDIGLIVQCFYFLFPLAVVGILVADSWPERLMRLAWLSSLYGVYAAYYWVTPNMSYYRFMFGLLPLVIGMAYRLIEIVPAGRWTRHGVMLLVCVGVSVHHAQELRVAFEGKTIVTGARASVTVAEVVAACLPDNAVIFSTPPFHQFLGTQKQFCQYNLDVFAKNYVQGAFLTWADQGSEVSQKRSYWQRQSPRGQELRFEWFRTFYGDLSDSDLAAMKQDLIREYLRELRPVVMLIPAGRFAQERNQAGSGFEWKTIREWDVPQNGKWGIYQVTLAEDKKSFRH